MNEKVMTEEICLKNELFGNMNCRPEQLKINLPDLYKYWLKKNKKTGCKVYMKKWKQHFL